MKHCPECSAALVRFAEDTEPYCPQCGWEPDDEECLYGIIVFVAFLVVGLIGAFYLHVVKGL